MMSLLDGQVEYSGDYETFSMARFGQQFVTLVANPRSILHWYRQRQQTSLSESTFLEDVSSSYSMERHLGQKWFSRMTRSNGTLRVFVIHVTLQRVLKSRHQYAFTQHALRKRVLTIRVHATRVDNARSCNVRWENACTCITMRSRNARWKLKNRITISKIFKKIVRVIPVQDFHKTLWVASYIHYPKILD